MKKQITSNLLVGLKFVSTAQKDIGSPFKQFCQVKDEKLTAFDGVLAAGCTVEEDLEVCPHTKQFISALSKCGQTLSITQLEGHTLVVKSGKFAASVKCYGEEMPLIIPDEPIAPISDEIRKGFALIGHLAVETAQQVYLAAILLQSGSMISTNGAVCLEYWHGLNLPTMSVPKNFVSAVCSTDKKLTSVGCSQSSLTFWFEDKSWLKTQTFKDPWPDMSSIFPAVVGGEPLPEGFFEAVKAVEDFSELGKEKGYVFFSEKGISSHKEPVQGAVYEVQGLPTACFAIRQLKNIERCCDKIVWGANRGDFLGNNLRGVIMGVKL